jgi:hypothetical protein
MDKPGIARIEHIAGGRYFLSAQADSDTISNYSQPYLYDRRPIEIKPGVVNRVEAVWPSLDTTVEPDDRTISGRLLDPTDQPVAGKTIYLRALILNPMEEDFGPFYPPQVSDSEGRFSFIGVEPDEYYQLLFPDFKGKPQSMDIDQRQLEGSVALEVEAKQK